MREKAVFSCLIFFFISSGLISPMRIQATARPNHLNFLIITIDTLRPDRLSCYSDEYVKTPHIDALAERGALFLKAFAHTPTTLTSHTNIMLGGTPNYHGVHDNHNFIVRPEFLTLAEHLKSYGYATAAVVGAFPLDSRFGLTQGFDMYDDNYGIANPQEFSYVERKAEVVVQRAVKWLENRSSPWFLWVHCFDPHQRYNPPEPFKTEYKNHPYNGEVAYVDSSLGRLFDFLENNDLAANTLIILTADHGESLGEHGESTHGYFAYNSTLRIPLIITYPGIKAQKIDQYVCHTDIFPTVCDILGLKKPKFCQGLSLIPVIKGKKLQPRPIYFESLYPYYSRGWAPLRGIIYDQKKYINSPIPEFYDLKKDFHETVNLKDGKNMNTYNAILDRLMKKQAYKMSEGAEKQMIDRRTQEKLRSLGYISSPQVSKKQRFTAQDDLKTLLPYQSQLQQAMGAYHRGDIPQGIKILKKIIQERKNFDLAYAYLASLYKEQKKYKEAVKILQQGYANCPSSYKVMTTFGIFLTEIAQYDAAIEILEKALTFIDYDPETWNYLGVAYWKKGNLKKALEAYQKSLDLDHNYPIAFNNIGSAYLLEFEKTKKPQDHRQAVYNFKKAIELDPNYASAYNGLGAAYRYVGNLDGAIYCWEKAVALNPDFGFALFNLGLAYLAKGDHAKALEVLTKYKNENYQSLSPAERNKLDTLLQKIQNIK